MCVHLVYEHSEHLKYSGKNGVFFIVSQSQCFSSEKLNEMEQKFDIDNCEIFLLNYDPLEWRWELSDSCVGRYSCTLIKSYVMWISV